MMIRKSKKILPAIVFIFLASLACSTSSIPFLDSAPESEDIEETDPNMISTMVAESVAEKVSQTLEAMPPTNTPLPPPTETSTPMPTPTEMPPTSTPTKIVYPETGSVLQKDVDGSIIYLDYTGGYLVKTPENWLAIRIGEQEYIMAWSLLEASPPEIQSSLQDMQSLDPNTFRLFMLDTQEGHYDDGFVTNINLVLSLETDRTLEEVFAESVLALPLSIPDLVIISSEITETSSGEPVGIIISEWDAKSAVGDPIRLYQKQTLFMIKDQSLEIKFTSTVDFKDEVVDDFDLLVDGFMLLDN